MEDWIPVTTKRDAGMIIKSRVPVKYTVTRNEIREISYREWCHRIANGLIADGIPAIVNEKADADGDISVWVERKG